MHRIMDINLLSSFSFSPALSFSGFIVGLLVGLTGVGGGSLMTPLLVLLFGFKPATAVGTDLLYAAITKSGGSWVHHKHKNVDWGITGRLAMGSVPAALVTVLVLAQLGVKEHGATGLISVMLGIALVLTAASLIFRQRLLEFARRRPASADSEKRLGPLTIIMGAAMGVLVTVSSVGAGALGVTVLTFLYPNLPTRRIVGSDIAHAVPLTFIAGLGHWWLGTVDFGLLGALLLGSLPGIAIGAHFAAKVPERALRGLLASVLMLIGGKLIFA
jgi:uncharacterized membrane protein YfcA